MSPAEERALLERVNADLARMHRDRHRRSRRIGWLVYGSILFATLFAMLVPLWTALLSRIHV